MHPAHVPAHLAFDRAPQRVYWEITRSCGLACRHCRAEATQRTDADELTHAEGLALLGRLAAFDPAPHVILTGGDPLERADLFALIRHARALGLDVSVSPSATPLLTPDVMGRFVDAGVSGSATRRPSAVAAARTATTRSRAARAPAWSASGDPLAEDPLCAYAPSSGA
jgi:hypothetical protein